MNNFLKIAEENQKRAWEIINETQVIEIWKSIGAEVNLVGSLRTGLLMSKKDIDLHIYTPQLNITESFAAISKLCANNSITNASYYNFIDTDEHCIQWQAIYIDKNGEEWKFDMVHILKGSSYDGYFEEVADRISAILTPETKNAILLLKYETPKNEQIIGIEYYKAVIEGGVRTYSEFENWRKENPVTGIVHWKP